MLEDVTRRRLRAGSAGLAVVGVAAFALGLSGSHAHWGGTRVAIRPGLQVEVPPRAAFGGTVAVYGTPYSDATPTEADLGCRIISSDGHSGALSHAGLESLDRLVIDGTAVLPLLKVTGGTGTASLECDGPASTRSQPMYLLSLPGAGELAPMAAYSVGTLTLVIGLAGMATLRPADH